VREAGQPAAQHLLENGLGEYVGLRVAVSAARRVPVEPGERPEVGVHELEPQRRFGDRAYLLRQADRLQDAEYFVVEVYGSRQRIDVGVSFHDETSDAPPAEHVGRDDADRPGADDDDRYLAAGKRLHLNLLE
jgi:hypothetical protein